MQFESVDELVSSERFPLGSVSFHIEKNSSDLDSYSLICIPLCKALLASGDVLFKLAE